VDVVGDVVLCLISKVWYVCLTVNVVAIGVVEGVIVCCFECVLVVL
jgi:hypothetical protein